MHAPALKGYKINKDMQYQLSLSQFDYNEP